MPREAWRRGRPQVRAQTAIDTRHTPHSTCRVPQTDTAIAAWVGKRAPGHRGSAARDDSRGGVRRGIGGRGRVGCGLEREAWQCRPCQLTGETHAVWSAPSAARWRHSSLSSRKMCSYVARQMKDAPLTSHDFIHRPWSLVLEIVVRSQTHLWLHWCELHRAPVQTTWGHVRIGSHSHKK